MKIFECLSVVCDSRSMSNSKKERTFAPSTLFPDCLHVGLTARVCLGTPNQEL